jgi:CheY-like chemotaxis protein
LLQKLRLSSNRSSAKPLNILAVDDEAGTRAALSLVLALDGHHAVFANDGDEALNLFENSQRSFDLIITDHQMVRVSGLDLARRLRERGFAGEIVVLTAFAGTFDEEEYKKLEVAGIMEKPFDKNELCRWLDCICESREAAAGGENAPGRSKEIAFCWLKHQ